MDDQQWDEASEIVISMYINKVLRDEIFALLKYQLDILELVLRWLFNSPKL